MSHCPRQPLSLMRLATARMTSAQRRSPRLHPPKGQPLITLPAVCILGEIIPAGAMCLLS